MWLVDSAWNYDHAYDIEDFEQDLETLRVIALSGPAASTTTGHS